MNYKSEWNTQRIPRVTIEVGGNLTPAERKLSKPLEILTPQEADPKLIEALNGSTTNQDFWASELAKAIQGKRSRNAQAIPTIPNMDQDPAVDLLQILDVETT